MPLPRLCAPDRPDWRWERIIELAEYSDTQAAARLQSEDESTQRGFRFKRQFDRGILDQDLFADVEAAHYTWLNQQSNRILLECFLITGAPDEEIAYEMYMHPDVVGTYHDLFFAVRPALERKGWMHSAVIGPHTAAGHHQHDRHGNALKMAYLVGKEVLLQMLGKDFGSPAMLAELSKVLRGTMVVMSTEQAIGGSFGYENGAELLRMSIDVANDSSSGDSGDELGDQVANFVKGLGLSVADPTEESNLRLPAREMREAEYEVTTDA